MMSAVYQTCRHSRGAVYTRHNTIGGHAICGRVNTTCGGSEVTILWPILFKKYKSVGRSSRYKYRTYKCKGIV